MDGYLETSIFCNDNNLHMSLTKRISDELTNEEFLEGTLLIFDLFLEFF